MLVAIIFPDSSELIKIAAELNIENKTFSELCESEAIIEYLIVSLNQKSNERKLKGFERIKRIHLIHTPFESEGLLTTTFKLKRHLARQFYKDTLEKLYIGLN